MWFAGYLLIGAAYWVAKTMALVALLAFARANGQTVPEIKGGVAAHIVTLAVWPIDLALISYLLTTMALKVISVRLTERRLRRATEAYLGPVKLVGGMRKT